MDAPALRALVLRLREALSVRERQIERKAEEVAQMAEVADALQRRNAELAHASKEGEAVAEIQRWVAVGRGVKRSPAGGSCQLVLRCPHGCRGPRTTLLPRELCAVHDLCAACAVLLGVQRV